MAHSSRGSPAAAPSSSAAAVAPVAGGSSTALVDERTPPPELGLLCRLQLLRTPLASFIEWRNFEEVVRGCYVRVLLELRSDDSDHYYVACVKGVQKGPSYSGFGCEGATTQWHLVVELPPWFRASHNGSIVQLNSISNSPFRQSEYAQWVQWTLESGAPFMSRAQFEFRIRMLEEHQQQALTLEWRKPRYGEDPTTVERRERIVAQMKQEMTEEIKCTYVQLPTVASLGVKSIEELQQVESEVLDLISNVRLVINEKAKCMSCRRRMCTVICYPCKHQVLCKDCSEYIEGVCPAPGCATHVTETFEAYTS